MVFIPGYPGITQNKKTCNGISQSTNLVLGYPGVSWDIPSASGKCSARIETWYVQIRHGTNTTPPYWYVFWYVFLYVLKACIDTCLVCIDTYQPVLIRILHVLLAYLVCMSTYQYLIHANTYLNTCINTCPIRRGGIGMYSIHTLSLIHISEPTRPY